MQLFDAKRFDTLAKLEGKSVSEEKTGTRKAR